MHRKTGLNCDLSDAASHLSRPYDLYLLYRQNLLLSVTKRGVNPTRRISYKLAVHGLYQKLRLYFSMPTTPASSPSSVKLAASLMYMTGFVLLAMAYLRPLLLLEFPPLIRRRQNRLWRDPR